MNKIFNLRQKTIGYLLYNQITIFNYIKSLYINNPITSIKINFSPLFVERKTLNWWLDNKESVFNLIDLLEKNNLPVESLPGDTDLFIIIGQSNAAGVGNSAESPVVTVDAIEMSTGGNIISDPLVDPVGDANTGSMWPAFANEFGTLTNRKIAICEAAGSGNDILPIGVGDWRPGGTLANTALSACNNCITTLNADSNYDLGRVFYMMVEGETDAAVNIDRTEPLTGLGADDFNAAIVDLCQWLKDNSDQYDGTIVIPTGQESSPSNQGVEDFDDGRVIGYCLVRQGTLEAISQNPDLFIQGYVGLFSQTTIKRHVDASHYNQTALNESGKITAKQLNQKDIPLVSSSILDAQAFIRNSDSNVSDLTESYTTPNGCDFLIVAVSQANNSIGNEPSFNTTVTFNGIEMIPCGWQKCYTNPSSGGIVNRIFFLNEDIYGGSLSNVSANIIVENSTVTNQLHFAVVSAQGLYLPDQLIGTPPLNAETNSYSLEVVPATGALIISFWSYLITISSIQTCDITGGTEIANGGNIRGTTFSGFAISYKDGVEPLSSNIFTINNFSNEPVILSGISCAFRPKIEGETSV